jgi:hypothetical protein
MAIFKNNIINVSFTIKIIIIAIIAFLVINAWDEVFNLFVVKILKIDRDSIWSWLIVAILATASLVGILFLFKVEAHDLLGISETVDTQLTGQVEHFEHGQVIHTESI